MPARPQRSRSESMGPNKMARRRCKKTLKGKIGRISGEIAHPEFITLATIKKRRNNPRSNVTISGKKKNKILKQMRIMAREKNTMQVEEAPVKKVREIEMAEIKPKPAAREVVMAEVKVKPEGKPTVTQAEENTDSKSSSRRSRSKKRKSKADEMDIGET